MQLLQETGNKKHIFYEDVFLKEYNFSQAYLVYYELLDSCVLSIIDFSNKKLIAVKLCDLNSYKIDNWFQLDFKSIVEIKTQTSITVPSRHVFFKSDLIDSNCFNNDIDSSTSHSSVLSLYSKEILNSGLKSTLYIDFIDSRILFILYNQNQIQFSHFESCQTFDEFWYFMFNMLKVNDCNTNDLCLNLGVNFYIKYPELIQILESYFEDVHILKSNLLDNEYPLLREKLFLLDCFLK
jgi:hypothetical protein